ncbi:MAG TPA: alginate lyase family protein [Terriglobales bacterium]|nr:alginate lyase family protein [Terriglobales bacterium]
MPITRRRFCADLGTVAGGFAFSRGAGWKNREEIPDVRKIDRGRILNHARQYLKEQPITITAYSSPRSAGGKHDYFSEGDYWWPDPKNPGGPYIQRDGLSNPGNFNSHRLALIRLSLQAPALTAAWLTTRDKRYSEHAKKHLRAWFLDPSTLMNPNLQYAQAIHGRTTGRGIGIIDTLHLVEVARSMSVLEQSHELAGDELSGLKKWFADYLHWMTTSQNGKDECNAKNNHGTSWLVQAAEFASFTGKDQVTAFCRQRLKETIVPNQVAADGSFPLELRRTKPYGYCIFNLDVMAAACQILSTRNDNLFRFTLPDGRGFAKAISYMFPYIVDKGSWPHRHDVEYWDDWPVRQPSLLFGGIALNRPEYFAVWKRLNPDPTVPEIIRNYPFRQPVLWAATDLSVSDRISYIKT